MKYRGHFTYPLTCSGLTTIVTWPSVYGTPDMSPGIAEKKEMFVKYYAVIQGHRVKVKIKVKR